MKIFKKFFKRKEEKRVITPEGKKTELEELCGDDKETYEALYDTMLLDPRKVGMTMEEAIKKAKEAEKSGDLRRTRISYSIAGGLAIFEGNIERVKEIYSKLERMTNKSYSILKNPERAVEKAQEYYKKYLP